MIRNSTNGFTMDAWRYGVSKGVSTQACAVAHDHQVARASRQGRRDSSPALQCWVERGRFVRVPAGTTDIRGVSTPRSLRPPFSALKRLVFQPSLPGLTIHISLVPSTEVLGLGIGHLDITSCPRLRPGTPISASASRRSPPRPSTRKGTKLQGKNHIPGEWTRCWRTRIICKWPIPRPSTEVLGYCRRVPAGTHKLRDPG